jgi:hypothetical protein
VRGWQGLLDPGVRSSQTSTYYLRAVAWELVNNFCKKEFYSKGLDRTWGRPFCAAIALLAGQPLFQFTRELLDGGVLAQFLHLSIRGWLFQADVMANLL